MEIDFRHFSPKELHVIARTAYYKIKPSDISDQADMMILRQYAQLQEYYSDESVTKAEVETVREACIVLSEIMPYAFENVTEYLTK